jgi:hypothetical protein
MAKTAKFWSWFSANRATYETLITSMEEAGGRTPPSPAVMAGIQRLHDALAKYDNRLKFEFGRDALKRFDLVITAEGNPAAFDSVFKLVAAAPAIAGWVFTPLKPRRPEALPAAEVEGKMVSSENFRFHVAPDPEAPGKSMVLVLVDAPDLEERAELYEQLAFLSVDAQLGELDSVRLVSGVMVLPLAMFRAESGHDGQPIVELSDTFPAAKAN